MIDLCIIICGQSTHVNELKLAFKDCKYQLIFSCWKGDEVHYTEHDLVLFNTKPIDAGSGNIHYQKISILNALYKAQNMNFNRVLKLRSDIIPTNVDKFIELIDNDAMNILCWHNYSPIPEVYGYYVDYIISGNINQLIDIWSNVEINIFPTAELCLTKELLKHSQHIKYFLKNLSCENDLFWVKYNKYLSSYNEYPEYWSINQ